MNLIWKEIIPPELLSDLVKLFIVSEDISGKCWLRAIDGQKIRFGKSYKFSYLNFYPDLLDFWVPYHIYEDIFKET